MRYEFTNSLHLFKFLLFYVCLNSFFFKVGTQEPIQAHIDISNPNQCKTTYHVTDPVCHQQMEISKQNKNDCHVMAETIFARKEIEELPG
jgi:hypothetical protein